MNQLPRLPHLRSRPPAVADEFTPLRQMLSWLVGGILALVVIIGLLLLWLAPGRLWVLAVSVVFYLPGLSVALWFLRRNQVRAAAHWIVGSTWLVLMISSAMSGGVRGPAYTGTLIVALSASLVLDWRTALRLSAASLLWGGALVAAEYLALWPYLGETARPEMVWFSAALYLGLALTLLRASSRTLFNALHAAQTELGERQAAQEALAARTIELRGLLQAVPDMCFRLTADGTFLEYYANSLIPLYRPPAEFLGRRLTEVLPPGVVAALQPALEAVVRTRQPATVDYAMPLPAGEDFYEARLVPFGANEVIAVVRDVSDRRRAEAVLHNRDAILETVTFAGQRMMRGEAWRVALPEVLARLGGATGASHVYVFENHDGPEGRPASSQRYEWTAPGQAAHLGDRRYQSYDLTAAGLEPWLAALRRGQPFFGTTHTFTTEETEYLEDLGVKSYVEVPVMVSGGWWGFLGLDDCIAERQWSPVELEALSLAAGMLGAAIERQTAEAALRQRDAILGIVAASAGEFLRAPDWRQEIPGFLARLGAQMGVSHVYIFENHLGPAGEELASQRYEWAAPGAPPMLPLPQFQAVPLAAEGYAEWEAALRQGQAYARTWRTFGEREMEDLLSQGLAALLEVPIFVGTTWWGTIGLDDARFERDWSPPEIDAVTAAAATLGAAIQRQTAEAARRESETRYQRYVEASPAGVVQLGPTGDFVDANPAACQILGRALPDLLGRSILDIIQFESGELISQLLTQRHVSFLARFLRPDRTSVPVHIQAVPFGPGRYLAYLLDMSEQWAAEQQVRVSEERLRLALEAARMGTWDWDIAQGAILWTGSLMPEWHAGADGTPLGLDAFVSRLHPNDRERVVMAMAAVLTDDTPEYHDEYRILTAAEQVRWIESHGRLLRGPAGRPVRLIGTLADITERKETAERLRESEATLRRALRAGQQGVWDWNVAAGIVHWSEEVAALFGVPPGAFDGTFAAYQALLHPEDRDQVLQTIEQALATGERGHIEHRVIWPNGSVHWLESDAEAVAEAGRPAKLLGTVRDVTERNRAAAALRESDRRLRELLESVQLLTLMVDLAGRITFCNAYLLTLTGWEWPEVQGRNWFEQFVPADLSATQGQLLAALAAAAVPVEYESEILTRAGERRLIHWSNTVLYSPDGAVTGLASLGRDITESRRSELAIAESEQRYRTLFEQAFEGIALLDPADGRVLEANPAFRQLLGYSETEVRHLRLIDISTHDQASVEAFLTQMAQAPGRLTDERTWRRKDGARVYVDVSASGLAQYGGRPALFIAVNDITARRQAEDDLRATTQQLWQAAKLATMGELAAGIAHELNNPLATINLRSEMLLEGLPADDPRRRPLQIISQEAERMAQLVSGLLEFSRRGGRQIASLNVREELQRTLELVQPHIRRAGIAVQVETPPDLPPLAADRQQMRQVFLNLFTNAVDAMPAGGTLSVRARLDAASPLEARWGGAARSVVIEVADTGVGVPPELRDRILEPFFTTKPEGKGTGLGLPICKRIVEEHGGVLRLESPGPAGSGTLVSVCLPAPGPAETGG